MAKEISVTVRGVDLDISPAVFNDGSLLYLSSLDADSFEVEDALLAAKLARKIVGASNMRSFLEAAAKDNGGTAPATLPVDVLMDVMTAVGKVSDDVKN